MLKNRIRYTQELEQDLFENCSNYVVPKAKIKDFFRERLLKYAEADDGRYEKSYLTRGELELVDRYGECKEIAEILLNENIELPKECISKDRIKEKIDFYKRYGKIENSNEYVMSVEIEVLEELLGEEI